MIRYSNSSYSVLILPEAYRAERYWCINGNYWCKNVFSLSKATEESLTMINCTNCIDCRNCTGCTECLSCRECTDCHVCVSSRSCVNSTNLSGVSYAVNVTELDNKRYYNVPCRLIVNKLKDLT